MGIKTQPTGFPEKVQPYSQVIITTTTKETDQGADIRLEISSASEDSGDSMQCNPTQMSQSLFPVLVPESSDSDGTPDNLSYSTPEASQSPVFTSRFMTQKWTRECPLGRKLIFQTDMSRILMFCYDKCCTKDLDIDLMILSELSETPSLTRLQCFQQLVVYGLQEIKVWMHQFNKQLLALCKQHVIIFNLVAL